MALPLSGQGHTTVRGGSTVPRIIVRWELFYQCWTGVDDAQ